MKKFEEPKFEKTEFEAVAYLAGSSKKKGGSHSNSHKGGSHSHKQCRMNINPFDNRVC